MKIILELPDTTTSLGLFINKQQPDHIIATTNWLTKPEDGKVIHVDEACKITERRADEDGI